jgi:hypothetical protein
MAGIYTIMDRPAQAKAELEVADRLSKSPEQL